MCAIVFFAVLGKLITENDFNNTSDLRPNFYLFMFFSVCDFLLYLKQPKDYFSICQS